MASEHRSVTVQWRHSCPLLHSTPFGTRGLLSVFLFDEGLHCPMNFVHLLLDLRDSFELNLEFPSKFGELVRNHRQHVGLTEGGTGRPLRTNGASLTGGTFGPSGKSRLSFCGH